MSSEQASSRQARLEAYLDHRLNESERAAFERELSADPEMRDAVERQAQIDDALNKLFPVPPLEQLAAAGRLAAAVSTPTAPRVARFSRVLRPLAAAAMIALVLLGGWQAWLAMNPRKPSIHEFRTLATVYRDESRGDFQPAWVCATDKDFADFVAGRFGHPMLARRPLPEGVEILGWSLANSVSPLSAYMLCRVDGYKVLVFVDLLENESADVSCTGPPVLEFRREIGPFVAYEVTPLDKPRVLDLLYQPE